jgi:hypothetical protein
MALAAARLAVGLAGGGCEAENENGADAVWRYSSAGLGVGDRGKILVDVQVDAAPSRLVHG